MRVVARDPVRAPVAQGGAKARGSAPARRLAHRVPDLYGPPTLSRRRERAPGVDDIDRAGRLDSAAVPQPGWPRPELLRVRRHEDPICRLPLVATRRVERPAQTRRGMVDARHVATMFTAQIDRMHGYPFTAPAVRPSTIRRLKNMNMISGGIVINRMSANSRWYEVTYWLWKLNSVSWTVAFSSPGRKYERVGEVVEDGHRLDDDHRDRHRLQQREDDAEEDAQRAGAVDRGRLVELARDRGDEGAEEQNREGEPEGDLDQDHALQGLEQAELLENPDGRDDCRRDDQAAEDDHVGDLGPAARAALEDVGDHRREHDHDGDAGHRDDRAVDEGGDQHVVARLDRLAEVVDQHPVGRQRELELPRLGLRLGRREQDEDERHEEDHADRDDEHRAEQADRASHSCTSRRRRNE